MNPSPPDASATVAPSLPRVPWPQRWAPPRRSRFPRIAGWVIVALAVVGLINPASLAQAADEPLGVLGRVLGSVVVAAFGVAILFVFADNTPQTAPPRLINAVTLTRAQQSLPDDWVHFFPERRRGRRMAVGFGILAALLLAAGVAGFVTVFADASYEGVARIGISVLMGVLVLVGVFFGWAAIRVGIGRMRLGSFGQRSMGLAIGRNAVLVTGLESAVAIPWFAVQRVEADTWQFGNTQTSWMWGQSRADREIPTIVLHLHAASLPAAAAAVTLETAPGHRVFTLNAASSEVHPWVVWAALSFYADPRHRENLGTTFAQRELASWAAGVVAADRARR